MYSTHSSNTNILFTLGTTMFQMQEAAAFEYADDYTRTIKDFQRMKIDKNGLSLVNQGLRFDFASHKDLYC
jgi:hypothetical protein